MDNGAIHNSYAGVVCAEDDKPAYIELLDDWLYGAKHGNGDGLPMLLSTQGLRRGRRAARANGCDAQGDEKSDRGRG